MKNFLRKFIFKILGINYSEIKRYNDITSLLDDLYTEIGLYSYHNGAFVSRTTNAPITIGNYCSIARGVWLYVDDNFHQLSEVVNSPLIAKFSSASNDQFFKKSELKWKGICLGNDVWLGADCKIMPNVTIGDGAIVAAGAIVTNDVPSFAIVAGVPAKVVKFRFSEKEVGMLNRIQWWHWSSELIKQRLPDFYGKKEEFFEKYYAD